MADAERTEQPKPTQELGSGFDDPRMRGFKVRGSVEAVWEWVDRTAKNHWGMGVDLVGLEEAAGRVLHAAVRAERAMPPFARAAMDGFAVVGECTFGAEDYAPLPFRVVGRSQPGRRCPVQVQARPDWPEAVEIATGAPMPVGADAVVRAEAVRRDPVDHSLIWVSEPTPPGRHVGAIGEDVAVGDAVLEVGRRLRPQDLGILSALGWSKIPVYGRPKVAVLITGDELLTPGAIAEPLSGKIPDMNSVMLHALIRRDGGTPMVIGPLPDDREQLKAVMVRATEELNADLVLVSGGSSTGPEDHAPGLVSELGTLAFHGLALRPASPTGIGTLGDKAVPIVLLPGNPVSCLCAYDFFAGRLLRQLAGLPREWPYRQVVRPLAAKVVSMLGRVDYLRVKFSRDGRNVEPLATSGASILSSAVRADGFVVVPADCEGYPAQTDVPVQCYSD